MTSGVEFGRGLDFVLTESGIAVPTPIEIVLPPTENRFENTPNAEWLHDVEIDPSRPTLIAILGASGSGKDSSYKYFAGIATVNGWFITPQSIKGDPVVYRVQTITNRDRRVDQGEWPYEYYFIQCAPEQGDCFEQENHVIERSIHNGGIYYATSLNNIAGALEAGNGVAFIRNEMDGALNLRGILADCEARGEIINPNHVIVFVTPKDYDELWDRIKGRRNPLARVQKAFDETEKAALHANLLVRNSNGRLAETQQSVKAIIQYFQGLYVQEP